VLVDQPAGAAQHGCGGCQVCLTKAQVSPHGNRKHERLQGCSPQTVPPDIIHSTLYIHDRIANPPTPLHCQLSDQWPGSPGWCGCACAGWRLFSRRRGTSWMRWTHQLLQQEGQHAAQGAVPSPDAPVGTLSAASRHEWDPTACFMHQQSGSTTVAGLHT
jgi:hypothetical protein